MSTWKNWVQSYRITDGRGFRLKQYRTDDTGPVKNKAAAETYLARGIEELGELQDRLYASDTWSLLLIFQAMDAAGKDSTIKHVMSGVNPQGCQVFSFKVPSAEELDHDFLWRSTKCLPERGRIGIFNRSYYEEVLVVRVHPGLLDRQKLPAPCRSKHLWQERFEDIRAFERYLRRQGTIVRKFFLHVSREEQRRRFLSRIEQPEKNWKFSGSDVDERDYWNAYQEAYEDAIRHTATPEAPWHIIPADYKWFARLLVAATITETLRELNLQYPKLSKAQRAALNHAKTRLESEKK